MRRTKIELDDTLVDKAMRVRAARLYSSLRGKGGTVRGAVDCIIAHACLDLSAALLSPDSDFARIALHTPLSLA